jgi:predicted nuclease with TOPRIM domain
MDKVTDEGPRPERTQLRLRALIDELQAGVRESRKTLQSLHIKFDTLADRVDALAKDVAALKTALRELSDKRQRR